MRLRFLANNAEFDADEYSIICGIDGHDATGLTHELSFNRLSETAAEDATDDWGVHTQFDDQSNGGYDKVDQCRLSRTSLCVDLKGQLGGLIGVRGFDVELAINDTQYESLNTGLARIFRGSSVFLVLT